jgi:hypothetical protein
MSCSPFDLRDYYLKELTDPQQRQVEAHVRIARLPGRIGAAPPHPGGAVLAARRRNPAAHRVRLRPGIRCFPSLRARGRSLVGGLLGIDTAVARQVAQVDARQTEKTKQLMADLEGTRQRLLLGGRVN